MHVIHQVLRCYATHPIQAAEDSSIIMHRCRRKHASVPQSTGHLHASISAAPPPHASHLHFPTATQTNPFHTDPSQSLEDCSPVATIQKQAEDLKPSESCMTREKLSDGGIALKLPCRMSCVDMKGLKHRKTLIEHRVERNVVIDGKRSITQLKSLESPACALDDGVE